MGIFENLEHVTSTDEYCNIIEVNNIDLNNILLYWRHIPYFYIKQYITKTNFIAIFNILCPHPFHKI
jgi:hypothetical protein